MTRTRPSRSGPGRLPPPAEESFGSTWLAASILAGAVLAFCAPLLLNAALPLGSDSYGTMHYLQGFMKALSEGDLYPRWTDATNRGLGSPTFIFFPPLPWYGAAAASWAAGSVLGGMRLYIVIVAALSVITFHRLAREWVGPGVPAAAAAALYLLLPYHLLDFYQRFAISETTAFIFFPLILMNVRRTLDAPGRGHFLALALSYAGLIFTHVISTLIFSLFVGLWLAWEARGRWGALARPVLALACGAALSAPVLLPALLEKGQANISWVREMPNGDFRINFIFKDEILPGLGFKDPIKPPILKSAHSQLFLGAAAAALALALLPGDRSRRRRDVLAMAGCCGAAYLMQLEISTPVWRLVPELPTIQFPWRFQMLMVFASPLLVGLAMRSAWPQPGGPRPRGPGGVAAGVAILALAITVNLVLAWQVAHLKPFTFDENVLQSDVVTSWAEPAFTPVQFGMYRTFRQTGVDLPPYAFTEGTGEIAVETWASSHRVLKIDSAAGGSVRLRSFWFPGWAGSLDREPLELRPDPRYGAVTFSVPAGSHTVELRFEATAVRRVAAWVALGSILATAALAFWSPLLLAEPGTARNAGVA
ncbi:MAG: hypothetical protein HY049_05300 [Acidobacteria bacterium]|nr:hypothetical protein [Acidobacteriota bacterium]